MALKAILDSGEMMYKFTYIDIESDGSEQGNITILQKGRMSETWDRRLILTGGAIDSALYVYDPDTGKCETSKVTTDLDNSEFSYGSFLIPRPDGGYVNIGTAPEPDSNIEDYIFVGDDGKKYIRDSEYKKPTAFVLDSSFKITETYILPEEARDILRHYYSFDDLSANNRAVVDKDGYFYFYDSESKKVQVFSPEFEHLFELDRPSNINTQTFLRDNAGNVYFGHASETGFDTYYLRSIGC